MQKFVVGSIVAAALATASASFAADIARPVYKAPVYNWTGFYIGGNAGYAWSSDNSTDVSAFPTFANPALPVNTVPFAAALAAGATRNVSTDQAGFTGGGQLGYRWQWNTWVAGVEADFQYLDNKGSGSGTSLVQNVVIATNDYRTNLSATNSLDWLGTVRGQLGFTITPTFLVYATGGLAYGQTESRVTITQVGTDPAMCGTVCGPWNSAAGADRIRTGWVVGAGAEWMIGSNWSARIEYLHYDLGDAGASGTLDAIVAPPGGTVPAGAAFASIGYQTSTRFSGDIVRAGLNYKFDWGKSPVVAKY